LLALMHIKPLERDWPEIIAASDVKNPLLGEHGAARIYGPQKGADSRTVETLELALEQLAEIITQDFGCDFQDVPGAGAAGGMGFGLMSFCNAKIQPDFEIIAEVLKIEKAVAESDFVITGEGRIDAQTLAGKGPVGIAALARKYAKPVIAFAGSIEKNAARKSLADVFDEMIEIAPPGTSLEESMRNAAGLLETAVHSAMRKIRAGKLLSGSLHLSS
jgi:glycerate kinase